MEALELLLHGRHAGPFNVAGDGTMLGPETAEVIGMKRRRVPLKLWWRFAGLMWRLRQSETPPGNLHFAIHPWVVSTDKLKETTGWSPRHTTRETYEITMRARGALPAEPSAAKPELAAPVGA